MQISSDTHLCLQEFIRAVEKSEEIGISADVTERLADARKTVEDYARGDVPVYGLNTGLGGNLGHRMSRDEMVAFQQQIILGRACGTGEPLGENIAKAAVFARILGVAKGYSGLSVETFKALVDFYNAGLVPVQGNRMSFIPELSGTENPRPKLPNAVLA